jgi:NadR type nicotinamide-nucleotide adenylyltransferase
MKKYRTGLVVGKFSPLHKGHELLIQAAIDQCEKVVVISYSNPEFSHCEAEARRRWLAQLFPDVRTLVIGPPAFDITPTWRVRVPENDDSADDHRYFCANVLLYNLSTSVDAVFTSEEYGDEFARYLTRFFAAEIQSERTVEHVCVDKARVSVPTSGTALREDSHLLRQYTSPVVRSSLVKRIVILGGESSGKSTLAKALAERLGTRWVPEYGRLYCENIGGVENLRFEDLEHIGETQVLDEERVAELVGEGLPLICDTSPLTTYFYSSELFNQASPRLMELTRRQYDCVVLCEPTIPFDQDGTRFDEDFRLRGHKFYLEIFEIFDIPHISVSGSVEERVEQVLHYYEHH